MHRISPINQVVTHELADPGELNFARQLSQGVEPGAYHGSQMAGTAAGIGLSGLAGRLGRMLNGRRKYTRRSASRPIIAFCGARPAEL